MAKKTAAFALTFIIALQIHALEITPCAGILLSAASGKTETATSFSLNGEFFFEADLGFSGRFSVSVRCGAERAHGFINLNGFVPAGDYCGLSAGLTASVSMGKSRLRLGSGIQWLFPDAYASGYFLVPRFSLSWERTARAGESLDISLGVTAGLASSRVFRSYRLGIYVMGRWR